MVQKFSNLLVLMEAGTETVSPVLRAYGLVCIMHLSIERATPPPGLCGAMWGISMVFEGMVSPWGWGISQDLLSIFMESMEVGERGGDLTRA